MKKNKLLYLAMPMDLISEDSILKSVSEYKDFLKDLPIHVYCSYIPGEKSNPKKRTYTTIVEDGLKMLRKSDILLVDLSKEYDYFGAICEIVYAYQMNIPIVAYIGEKKSKNRPWLNYHVKHIHSTRNDMILTVRELIDKE